LFNIVAVYVIYSLRNFCEIFKAFLSYLHPHKDGFILQKSADKLKSVKLDGIR